MDVIAFSQRLRWGRGAPSITACRLEFWCKEVERGKSVKIGKEMEKQENE
jgi:hypothetical protein